MKTIISRTAKFLIAAGILLFLTNVVAGRALTSSVSEGSARVVAVPALAFCGHDEWPYKLTVAAYLVETVNQEGYVQQYLAYTGPPWLQWCPTNLAAHPSLADPKVVWILHHYYPTLPTEPHALATDGEKAAAVQIAIWYYTSGLNFMDDQSGEPANVFAAARDIVHQAEGIGWTVLPATPAALELELSETTDLTKEKQEVVVTVLDAAGSPVAGIQVEFAVTGANNIGPVQVTTGVDGAAVFAYTGTATGDDSIRAVVACGLPVGRVWGREGCQELIVATHTPVYLSATVTKTWMKP